MAIPDFVDYTSLDAAGTTPITFGTQHTSGSGANRAIQFNIVVRDSAGFFTVSGLTWDGVAATFCGRQQVADQSTGQEMNGEIWRLIDPAASTAGTVVVTLSGNATRVGVHCININGPTGPLGFDLYNSNEDDADPGTTAFSCGITTTGTDRLIVGAAFQQVSTATATWDELTEIVESGGSYRLVSAYGDQAASGAATYNGDWDTQNEWGFMLAAWYETPGDPPAAGSIKGSALRSSVLSPHAFGQGYAT